MLMCAHRSVTASAGAARTDSPAAPAAPCRRPAQQSGATASPTSYNKTPHFQPARRRSQSLPLTTLLPGIFHASRPIFVVVGARSGLRGDGSRINRRAGGELAVAPVDVGFTVVAAASRAGALLAEPTAALTFSEQCVSVALYARRRAVPLYPSSRR